jgi:RimJ/RimL family protein N-acetyltransferase
MEISTSKGNVIIRQAVLADVPAFRELRLQALHDHPTAFAMDYESTLSQPETYWQERLGGLGKENMIYFAEHEGQLAGMCGLYWRESPKIRHSATIWGVYVRPQWRGQQVAEALMDACLDFAREKQFTIVKLGVVSNNIAAIRCYARCGFKVYGVEPQVIRWDGVTYDELLMARTIG